MTADEMKRLRALCAAATEGPWELADRIAEGYDPDGLYPNKRYSGVGPIESCDHCSIGLNADVLFVQAARDALPALLDELEER